MMLSKKEVREAYSILRDYYDNGATPVIDDAVEVALIVMEEHLAPEWRTGAPPKDGTCFVGVYCGEQMFLCEKDDYIPELNQYVYAWEDCEPLLCDPEDITAWYPIPKIPEDEEE